MIAREGERIEAQRVDGRQLERAQARIDGGKVGQVEIDQVVAKHERGAFGHGVQSFQGVGQVALLIRQCPPDVAPHGGESMNAPVFDADFQIDRDAAWGDDRRSGSSFDWIFHCR